MKERGVTLTGFFAVSAMLVLVVMLGFKLIPPYAENYSLKVVLRDMIDDPDVGNASPAEIRARFAKHLEVSEIKSVEPGDLAIRHEGGKVEFELRYQVNVPLFANLSADIAFDTKVGK